MITLSPEFWKIFKEIPGAFSVTEAIALYNLVLEAPEGTYIELGTHRGKSTSVAMIGLKKGIFFLVEPEFKDNEWQQSVYDLIQPLNKDVILDMWAAYSTEILPKIQSKFSFVFWDSGIHQDGLPMQEALLLEDMVIPGGIIVLHDFRNQFREPAEAAEYLVRTGKYEWVDIDWNPIINYVRENNLEEGNKSWHVYDDRPFPNFVGAIKRK